MGGRHLVHNWGIVTSNGYFLEPFIVIGLFAKTPFLIRLAEDSQCKLQTKEYATLVRRTRRGTPTDELKEERRWKGESQPISSYAQGEMDEIDDEKKELMPPEDVCEQIASFLLEVRKEELWIQ